MAGPLGWLTRSVLFRFDPETAHRIAIRALALGVVPPAAQPDQLLRRRLFDLDFPSPVGLAAGFDKDAEAFSGLLRIGFGFVEVGTVTPRPQPGNPKPRMFRLESDGAIINRLGFNNDGMRIVHERLWRGKPRGIVGVNVGANRDASDRIADYVAGIETFADIASYLAINVSSPNTPGLRDLQRGDALRDLLQAAVAARDEVGHGQRATPLLLKIAPDLRPGELEEIADASTSAGIDGLIVANTTTDRRGLRPARHIDEAGGLSGRPLFRRSTTLLARLRRLIGSRMVLIGVGGIDSVETAWDKITAGADLIQIYTGMIYRGHGLAAELNRGLAARLAREGFKTIREAVGTDTDRWAETKIAPST
jgi:dihydroorotate dehydrogenase